MLKKIIQVLLIAILALILSIIVVLVFNPFNTRTKIISGMINSYLENTIEGYTPIENVESNSNATTKQTDKHPLLNESQEKTLETFGVNVEQLPSEITPSMSACFIEKLGQERAMEIVNGAAPGVLEIIKAKDCLGE